MSQPAASRPPLAGLLSVGGLTLVSRVLGLARDIGMAAAFGGGPVLDAFTVAFRLPNLTRRLFGEGAFSAAFLPVFVRELRAGGTPAAWRIATAVFVLLAIGLTVLTAVAEAGLWLTWGWTASPETRLLVSLTAVLFPYQIALCIAAQAAAVLHAFDRFALPAILPVVMNLAWLAALVCLVPRLNSIAGAHAVAAAVTLSGLLQLGLILPALRGVGFEYVWEPAAARPAVREILAALAPVLLGLSVTEINGLADSLFAWLLTAETGTTPTAWQPLHSGTAAALYLGQRLYQFPLGVFGVALGTVLFPRLARHAAAGRLTDLRDDLTMGLSLSIAVGVPASVGLLLLASPLSVAFFRHGAFDAADAARTAAAVAAYAAGIWAYIALLIAHRGFYAVGDRLTPLYMGCASALVNLLLNTTLVWKYGATGLAAATSLAAAGQLGLLLFALHRRGLAPGWLHLGATATRAALATAAMAVACVLLRDAPFYPPGTVGQLLAVLVPLSGGAAVYAAAATLLGLGDLRQLLPRR